MAEMIGRNAQMEQIKAIIASPKSEFVAVMGRRRVGKTYLIDNAFAGMISFQMTGIQKGTAKEQLENFNRKLFEYSNAKYLSPAPNNWGEAFFQLKSYLETKLDTTKQVIFLDELPWISSSKSGFLQQLAHFWNDYLSKKKHYILVICGSVSSWIAKNITNDKGGLHNRITEVINLKPFSLLETKQFLASKNINITSQEIAKLYMTFGGIPYYLDNINRGESAMQAIERLCFEDGGKLKNEYENLYKALFNNAIDHEKIVETLAGSQKGMLRAEILAKSKIRDGGPFNRAMSDLLICGFVSTMSQFGQKKREEVYRLNDEYSAFYHRFIKQAKKYSAGSWVAQASSQPYKIWLGYAFELLCFKHISQIKAKLGIGGVYSEISTFYPKKEIDKDLQIDMLIDRKDNTINFCEIKNYESRITIDKPFYQSIKERIWKFNKHTKKQVFFVMITNEPITENEFSLEIVDKNIVLDDLFEK
jgi:uncharacterized protein